MNVPGAIRAALCLLFLEFAMPAAHAGRVITWPAPDGEPASALYTVTIEAQPVFVYRAEARHEIDKPKGSIWTHRADATGEEVAFALFEMEGPVEIVVTAQRDLGQVAVLPRSAGIAPRIEGRTIRFTLDRPRPIAILPDDTRRHALHLFAYPPETEIPAPNAPGVHYVGPGIHDLASLRLKDGETLYLAKGAIVRGIIGEGETGRKSERTGLTGYGPWIRADRAKNIAIRGRGILDSSLLPHAAKSTITLTDCERVRIDGIVIRNAANWAVNIRTSHDVEVSWVHQISGRLNSDGINSVSSHHVHIHDCFVRNRDDAIVVKTMVPERPAHDILVERCTIWGDWGFALGVSYETRADIQRLHFRDCDILYSEHWALGVYVVDAGTVSEVRFEDIRVDYANGKLLRFALHKDMWATDPGIGHIRDLTVRHVTVTGGPVPPSEIVGKDAEHRVEQVLIENLVFHGQPVKDATAARLAIDPHTAGIEVR